MFDFFTSVRDCLQLTLPILLFLCMVLLWREARPMFGLALLVWFSAIAGNSLANDIMSTFQVKSVGGIFSIRAIGIIATVIAGFWAIFDLMSPVSRPYMNELLKHVTWAERSQGDPSTGNCQRPQQ